MRFHRQTIRNFNKDEWGETANVEKGTTGIKNEWNERKNERNGEQIAKDIVTP